MSNSKVYFVGGLFIGTVIGGTLGLLLAPSSGDETRKKITEGTEEVLGNAYDQAMEYGENLKEQFKDMQEQFTDRVNEYKSQIEDKIEEIQDEVQEDIQNLNDQMQAAVISGKETVGDVAEAISKD